MPVRPCPNRTGPIQGHNKPTPKGTDHNPLIDTDMGGISMDHNHIANPTMTGAAAVTEGMHNAPHPAPTLTCATLWQTYALMTTHAETHPPGIVTPHLKHATSPTDIIHATTPWTVAGLPLATLTALHKDHSRKRKSSHTQGL